MAEVLIVLSALIGVAAFIPYITLTIQGKVRPQLVTWGIWTVLAAVLTISALQQGQITSAVLSSQALLGCGIVVLLGARQGQVKLTRLDIICLMGAVAGVASLAVFRDPALAIFIAVAVDSVAFIPTLRHAWQKPEEESLISFALATVAGSLALGVALSQFTQLSGVIYPMYSFLFNGTTVALLILSRQANTQYYRTPQTESAID